jgi:D-3-phosphoglycerate dehydrogenase
MKVLVADKFESSGLEALGRLGVEVEYEPSTSSDDLGERLQALGAEVLIVRSTKVTGEAITGTKLGLIVRAGAGTNTIDVATASDLGIMVSNCPGKNAQAVAELAFGLILACDRRIPDNVAELRAGRWNKGEFTKSRGLYGRTLGLVGMGKISQEMTVRARAFGMKVATHSRWMTDAVAGALDLAIAESAPELAALSDVVSVHVALTPATRGLIDEEFFAALRPGSIFVNTSRAEVVDQAALEKAVREKGIRAGLDVFEEEPTGAVGTYNGSLRELPGVYATHHIGASTDQAQEAVAAETVRLVREFKNTGIVPNLVNLKRAEIATHLLVVRHADRVGVLAGVLARLKEESISVQEMENIILGGAKAAIAQIALDKEPSPSLLLSIKMDESVFGASVLPIEKV